MTNDAGLPDHLSHAREFLEIIHPLESAYCHGRFAYAAVLHQGEQVLLGARFDLLTRRAERVRADVATANVRAQEVRLPLRGGAVCECIHAATTASWLRPTEDLLLKLVPKEAGGRRHYDAYFEVPPARELQTGGCVARLVLSGTHRNGLIGSRSKELDKELRQIGIDSIGDLMRMYELQDGGCGDTRLEVVAHPVAAFDPQSRLEGRRVHVRVQCAAGLDRRALSVVVRDADPNVRAIPLSLDGARMAWAGDVGECRFDLPGNAIVDCRVTYAGHLQAQMRLVDASALPSVGRMLVDLVDSPPGRFEQVLLRPKRDEARDHEVAVAWLLQLLGFTVWHVSAMSFTQKEPDILALARSGEVLLVECTTDVPDDDKLSKLISRVSRVRERLQARPWLEAKAVVALLVTPLQFGELAGIQEKAEQHGIITLCRDELQAAVERAKFEPRPDEVLRSWLQLDLTRVMTGQRPIV